MHTETVLETNDIETVVAARAGDTLGYARVSTNDQNLDAQCARLTEAGAIRVFTDIVSGKRATGGGPDTESCRDLRFAVKHPR